MCSMRRCWTMVDDGGGGEPTIYTADLLALRRKGISNVDGATIAPYPGSHGQLLF